MKQNRTGSEPRLGDCDPIRTFSFHAYQRLFASAVKTDKTTCVKKPEARLAKFFSRTQTACAPTLKAGCKIEFGAAETGGGLDKVWMPFSDPKSAETLYLC